MAKKKLGAWQKFVKANKGKGMSLKQLSAKFKGGSKKTATPVKRKKATAKKVVGKKATAKKVTAKKVVRKKVTAKKVGGKPVKGAWQKFVKAHKGKGFTLKQLSAKYIKGSSVSKGTAKVKPSKSKARAKRLTPANCEAVKTHSVAKGYKMTLRKRKAGKRRTNAY